MHDHDLDLVMAIAAGEAVDDNRRAEVDGCPECSADLAAQQAALAALSTLGTATLEPQERETLRAAIREELHLADPATPAPSPGPARRFTWAWAGAAAMVLIGFVAVAGLRTGGDDAADTAALATSTTVAATTSTAASAQSDVAGESTAPSRGGDGLSSTEDAEAPAEVPDLPYRFDFEGADRDTLRELASLSPVNAYAELGASAKASEPLPLELELACEDAGLAAIGPASDSYPLFEGTYEGSPAYLWVYVTSDGPVTVVHDAETCVVIEVLR